MYFPRSRYRTGLKGDKGDKGDTGDAGADGAPGADGEPGTNGADGLNAPQIWFTTGVPADNKGADGDVCFRTSTLGGIYLKVSGAWVLQRTDVLAGV